MNPATLQRLPHSTQGTNGPDDAAEGLGADTYLQSLDIKASTGVSRDAASNLLKLALEIATAGLGKRQPAKHGECHDARARWTKREWLACALSPHAN